MWKGQVIGIFVGCLRWCGAKVFISSLPQENGFGPGWALNDERDNSSWGIKSSGWLEREKETETKTETERQTERQQGRTRENYSAAIQRTWCHGAWEIRVLVAHEKKSKYGDCIKAGSWERRWRRGVGCWHNMPGAELAWDGKLEQEEEAETLNPEAGLRLEETWKGSLSVSFCVAVKVK